MKPHLDIAHAGTVDMDDKTRMTFDEASAAHLMSILTDLYSDRAMAVVREYSTNARDSHLAAGVDLPIAVTTPTVLNPVLRIQDFGLGMSVDEVLHNFSKYGWSSKRDNDIQNGMLGLGCKSALTYSSQFTMIAVKDGVQATVLITRDSDGAGAIKVIDTCSTSEPNGVEIQVPVVNVPEMTSRVELFFSYWNPGEVLVDGVQPYSVWTDTSDAVSRLDDDVIVRPGHGRSSVIVMGGVAYPAVDLMPKRWANDMRAIVRVEVGQVNFVPSREALASTKRTADTIETAREFIDARLERKVREQIDALPSRWEAREFLENHPARLTLGNVTYRGEPIPRSSGFDNSGKTFVLLVEPWNNERETADTQHFTPWRQAEAAAVNVTGFNLRYVTKLSKDLARFWIKQNNPRSSIYSSARDNRRIHFYAGNIPSEWMRPDTKIISFEELRNVQLPAAAQTAPKPKPNWRYMRAGDSTGFREAQALDFDNVAAWVGALDGRSCDTIITRTLDPHDKPYVVVLTEKQVAKFKAEHPDIPHYSTWVDRKYREFIKSLTPIEVIALRSRFSEDPLLTELHEEIEGVSRFKRMTRKLQRATVLDPELRSVIEMTGVLASNDLINQRSYFSTAWHAFCGWPHNHLFGIEPRLPQPDRALVQFIRSVVKRYPILEVALYYGGRNDGQIILDVLNNTYLSKQMLHLHPSTY